MQVKEPTWNTFLLYISKASWPNLCFPKLEPNPIKTCWWQKFPHPHSSLLCDQKFLIMKNFYTCKTHKRITLGLLCSHTKVSDDRPMLIRWWESPFSMIGTQALSLSNPLILLTKVSYFFVWWWLLLLLKLFSGWGVDREFYLLLHCNSGMIGLMSWSRAFYERDTAIRNSHHGFVAKNQWKWLVWLSHTKCALSWDFLVK